MNKATTALADSVFALDGGRNRARARRTASGDQRTLLARIGATTSASDRLLRLLQEGVEDFVIAAADGRGTVRVRLSLDSLEYETQTVGTGKVVVDWSRGTVTNVGSRVTLSRTELRLLSGLLEGHGTTVPRATLISRAWPKRKLPAAECENALGVYIHSLRKRLAAIGLRNALQTVRRVGYRLEL